MLSLSLSHSFPSFPSEQTKGAPGSAGQERAGRGSRSAGGLFQHLEAAPSQQPQQPGSSEALGERPKPRARNPDGGSASRSRSSLASLHLNNAARKTTARPFLRDQREQLRRSFQSFGRTAWWDKVLIHFPKPPFLLLSLFIG